MIKLWTPTKKISKETFKRWFGECNKEALIYDNLKIFKNTIKLINDKRIRFFKTEIKDEDDFNDSSPAIHPLNDYIELLNKNNPSKDDLEKIKQIELAIQSNEGIDSTAFLNQSIKDGLNIGEKAKELYKQIAIMESLSEGKKIRAIDLDIEKFNDSLEHTKEILKDPNNRYLFEASFTHKDVLRVKTDILINHGDNEISIVEVKATTKHKSEHIFDLAYQKYVLLLCGFKVREVHLLILNKDYYLNKDNKNSSEDGTLLINNGEKQLKGSLNVEEYPSYNFKDDVLPILNSMPSLEKYLEDPHDLDVNGLFLPIYKDSLLSFDGVKLSKFSANYYVDEILNSEIFLHSLASLNDNLNKCENIENLYELLAYKDCFYSKVSNTKSYNPKNEYCNNYRTWFEYDKYNLLHIFNNVKNKVAKFEEIVKSIYWKDIVNIELKDLSVSANLFKDAKTKKNKFIEYYNFFKEYLSKENIEYKDLLKIQDKEVLVDFLKDYYNFPVYMYDFETSLWAEPVFNNQSPYMQTPFQYSIDVLKSVDYDFQDSSTYEHFDFLADTKKDPRLDFIKKFVKDSFSSGPGVYVAYNKSFEKGVLKKLAWFFPEYEKPLIYIAQNTIDLLDFFQVKDIGKIIYDPNFKGSYSIKVTQPTLEPKLSYKDLNINKGDKASQLFRMFVDNALEFDDAYGNTNDDIAFWKEVYYSDMIKYCNRDTLAMVALLQKIIKIINDFDPSIILEVKKYNE